MKIYLVRHGIAYEPGTPGYEDDTQRPLTEKGRDKMTRIARAVRELGAKPNYILSSPYIRARQTAEIFAKALKYKKDKLVFSPLLAPMGPAGPIIAEITEKYETDELLIVGHEPCLSGFVSALAAGTPDLAINIKNGGVCCMSADDLRTERKASIEWLLTPKISTKI
jgi:phosphohistidine phosphatase